MLMDWLLLATGFTGALTAVYLTRLVRRSFFNPPGVTEHGPDRAAALTAAVEAARSEVLWLSAAPPTGEVIAALGRCKERAVEVVVLVGAAAEKDLDAMHALAERHVEPLVAPEHAAALTPFVVIDGQTVLVGNLTPPAAGEAPDAAPLLAVSGVPALAAAYRQDFAAHRGQSRKAQAKSPAAPTPRPQTAAA
jgi:hypothetical protein